MNREELAKRLNDNMVNMLKHDGKIVSPSVEHAFRSILRHQLLPNQFEFGTTYTDTAIILKKSSNSTNLPSNTTLSSSTMPSLLAGIIEASKLEQGMRILQVGTGPGYLVALLAHIITEKGTVVTIEIDKEIGAATKDKLHSIGIFNIECIIADGYFGCVTYAPYDRIIVTASCTDIPVHWIEQLKNNGLLILPLSFTQRTSSYPMIVFHKEKKFLKGEIIKLFSRVGFLPLYGENILSPVIYDKEINQLEIQLDLLLAKSNYKNEEARMVFLFSMLTVAEEIENGLNNISTIGAKKILMKAIDCYESHNKPKMNNVSLYLTPKGLKEIPFEWRFIKTDHDLLVFIEK